ncbi:MAG: EAL domain-containing protein, partial [Planctomycetota bacterium]
TSERRHAGAAPVKNSGWRTMSETRAETPGPHHHRDAVRAELDRIIENRLITTVFQPIVDLRHGSITAYEALTRCPPDSLFDGPGDLFDAASEHGCLDPLETITREQSVRAAGCWQTDPLLFLNTSPPVIARPGFATRFETLVNETPGISADRVVLEITERVDSGSLVGLHHEIISLREAGFQVALDDVGSGLSGLNRMMAIRPNWVKLDLELVQNVDQDPLQQNLLRSFIHFARLSNMTLIAEGIERGAELETLMTMGVVFGQGYHLARPSETPPAVDSDTRSTIIRLNERAQSRSLRGTDCNEASQLARAAPIVEPARPWQDLRSDMDGTGSSRAIVMDGEHCLGLVDGQMLERWTLEARAPGPVGAMALLEVPIVAGSASLGDLLDLAVHNPSTCEVAPIVVKTDGRIAGVITPGELVRTAAWAHQQVAASLGALATIPSRPQADQWLSSRITAGDVRSLAFIDLCDFGAYNLSYGVEMGDTMLQRFVLLMQQVLVAGNEAEGAFLAHLGEDRFVFAGPDGGIAHYEQLVSAFDDMLPEFFSSTHIAAQGFGDAARGDANFCPLTAIRVIVLESPCAFFESPRDIHLHVQQLRRRRHDIERTLFDDGQRRPERIIIDARAA